MKTLALLSLLKCTFWRRWAKIPIYLKRKILFLKQIGTEFRKTYVFSDFDSPRFWPWKVGYFGLKNWFIESKFNCRLPGRVY